VKLAASMAAAIAAILWVPPGAAFAPTMFL
jgi:hypothetical protein